MAKQYLKNAGLIDPFEKGSCVITQKWLNVLKDKPTKIDALFLKKIDRDTLSQTKKEQIDINIFLV